MIPSRVHLMRSVLGVLGAVGVLGSVEAGVLYRCVDAEGVTAYTSTTSGYRQCKRIGTYVPEREKPKSRDSGEGTGSRPAVEFRSASGDAEPKAVAPVAGPEPKVTRGAVYKFERNGVTHYTNRRPAGQRAQVLFTYIETCFACSAAPGLDFNNVGLNLTAYSTEIAAAAARHGVDEALVRAVIHAESAFNPNAISRAGAQGLMQLIPATATRFGVTEPFTPAQNIDGGTAYLAWLSERFGGDLKRIAAGYNAGEGAVDRYGGVPPYQETQLYVERVGILLERYRKELASKANPTISPPVATASAAAASSL
ncbi:MAG TPA: lytic transglycosylase domain-containing protein [Chiayiivirga sp.]|nr:lytic transglycosylase domain-containing protein [Chiayiivirga sp.]